MHRETKLRFWTKIRNPTKPNEMIIGWICIKIMSKNLIKILISQIDLIMGPIKDLIKIKNYLGSN